jgi:3-mercaptopropionate dioxygenase
VVAASRSYNRNMNTQRFTQFLDTMDALVAGTSHEPTVLDEAEAALTSLVAHDDWLPAQYALPVADRYQSYALYIDPLARYSVISFVWAPGQGTPVHNHTVWGLVGMMRGAERCEEFPVPGTGDMACTHAHDLVCGAVDRVSPAIGDWHKVSNALNDAPTISIHVYGADIGRVQRSFWDFTTQQVKPMISGYSNDAPWIAAR